MNTARPICKTKAATTTSATSLVSIYDLRFKATKEDDAAPVARMMVHRRNSTGITSRNWKEKGKLPSVYIEEMRLFFISKVLLSTYM